LLIHLRMTGSLSVKSAAEPHDAAERTALILDDGREIRFRDTRKFGRWTLTDDPDAVLGRLGPEPLSDAFTAAVLRSALQAHNRMLKPLLLDQHVVAGLGNIYVDEALWDARLHPCRLSRSLSAAESRRLHGAIRRVLQRGVDGMGTTLGSGMTNFYSVAGRRGRNQDALNVFRRHGDPCPRCQRTLERITVAQRSTHLCPRCQQT
jgi:formamidopyrimidine-DNA glycosylase